MIVLILDLDEVRDLIDVAKSVQVHKHAGKGSSQVFTDLFLVSF